MEELRKRYLHAFDLSIESPALAIFDLDTLEPVCVSSIRTNHKQSYGQRLDAIREWAEAYIRKYPPGVVAIERGFSRYNTSTQVIYRVHGVINMLYKDFEQIYYPPKKVKEVILHGKATKKQIAEAIREVYNINFANDDESDAFAVGLAYLIIERNLRWIKEGEQKRKQKKRGTHE